MTDQRYAYMAMSRCMMDLEFYINTMANYCGNCKEEHLFFGNIENHIKNSLIHYRTLPIPPKWLHKKKLHKLCSKAISLKYNKKKQGLLSVVSSISMEKEEYRSL